MVNTGQFNRDLGNFLDVFRIQSNQTEMKRENLIRKREKMTKIHKIKLMYASKSKYNILQQNIKKKTHNLNKIALEMI